ncbi:hypothetical protein CHARACLAT_004773 [Characodon lateralis]|uniref:Uncharacterized protein n=1 Tax=Characodon lateralis TaxID=208331 RepID=A0ABU7EQX3_9TELE|nr:hypothetical protein [Characodon lateralis]
MVTAHLLFIASGISYLYGNMFEASPSFSQWLTLLGEEFWVVALMIMNALTLLWEAWLLTEQFDAISARTTTFFRHSEGAARQRSLGQRWAVVAAFLLEGRRSVGSRQIGEDKTAIDI